MSPRARSIALAGALLLAAAPASATGGEDGGLSHLLYALLNFALLLGVIFYVARRPIREFFADRRAGIQSELAEAADLRKQAEERHAALQRKLADLDAELESIRRVARERAETESEGILADARAAAERIRRDAITAIEQETRRAQERLRQEASALSIELAAGLLEQQVTDSDRDRLLDEFIARVEQPTQPAGGGR